MAIVKTFSPRENTFLLVWKITEDAEALKNRIHCVVDEQTLSPKTNLHWLASRAALAGHFSNAKSIVIAKDAFNKPSMQVDGETYHLSITHSFQYAAVLFSTSKQVSLDLEKTDERVGRVANKFVNAAEEEMMKGSLNPMLDFTRIWSAKETLYKFYGHKELDFKMHMTVFINNLKALRGCIHKHNPDFYEIEHELFDNYVLTYIIQ